ncbi:DUF1993 domain-containing protein [Chamaesiphon sp. VAR_48_metabat_403]|uniref:DUF1993 domain-containing protein n=1 Tax=Chamaesiphon sp. VAR_48_metabat_403 TaxID=2964700 RepID=UPI00286E9A52|nr:DUF1993 domain-containing protein [Chamaesiphon sp. VAR_48_metabat_403]
MNISMYQASVPPIVRSLNNLITILEKGDRYAIAKKIESSILINSRLYPDMHPLSKQVQIASDVTRRGVARLAGLEAPSMVDNEQTFAELIDRTKQTITYLETIAPEQIDGSEARTIVLPMGKESITLQGMPYLNVFILPNLYFHVTTTYNILRHSGVELGKIDFLGKP